MNKHSKLNSLIRLMRPKQWTKNFFVLAALIFSKNLFNLKLLTINLLVLVLFCLASSCVYILNDIVDVEKDRCHPQKKFRPIASGEVSVKEAIVLNVILILAIFCSLYIIDIKILFIILAYLILNVLYSFKLKNVVIIDVMVIMAGFVLRVESGSIATNVILSPWLILCTVLLSLFLALNKRKSEILTLDENRGNHRKILQEYSIELIDKMLTIVTPSILMAYSLYTFNSTQSKGMMFTIPFVLYGIFRYEYLMHSQNIGGKPEDIFTKDRPFLINILLWGISIAVIIYFKF